MLIGSVKDYKRGLKVLKAEMVGRNYVILQPDFETRNSFRCRGNGRPTKAKDEKA